MNIRHFITGFSAIALSACASTGTTSSAKSSNPAFTSLPGGGTYHPMSGLECPTMLNGGTFEREVVFAPDGSDVGCSYKGADQTLTLYLTDDRGHSQKQAMAGALLSAAMVGRQDGLNMTRMRRWPVLWRA